MSKKRRREQPIVDTQLVEIYEDLANVDENIRLKAAEALLSNFVANGKSTGEQLNEIIRRLFRGLCSGRKAARLGFSVVLTELLIEVFGSSGKGVTGVQSVLELIQTLKNQSQVSSNVSGQEERDYQFGRLFGAESIIKSEILFQPSTEFEAWSNILDIIYELAKKKPWLREECGFILFNSIHILKSKDFKYAQMIIDQLLANGLSKTSQGVAIWIGVRQAFPSMDLPRGVWHHEDPLYREKYPRVIKILMETSAATSPKDGPESETVSKGAWATKLPFAWDVISAELLDFQPRHPQKNTNPNKRTKLADFWEQCIDEALFAPSSSEERKYWGFLLLQRTIPKTPVKIICHLFTKNLMRCLINQLASSERYLHRIAEKSIKALLARACSDPHTKAPFLKALLDPVNGDINFDKITKTKTVETLTSIVNDPAFEQVVEIYEDLILRPGVEDEKTAASRRQSAADYLVSAVRSIQVPPTEEDLTKSECLPNPRRILALFAKYAYFDVDNAPDDPGTSPSPSPKISPSSREMFRTRISSCLSSLVAKSIGEPSYFAYELVCDMHSREENAGHASTVLNADDVVRSVLKEAWQTLRKVHTQAGLDSDGEARFFRSLELLYSLTILQVYNEEADAVGILLELNHSFKPLLRKNKRPRDSATLIEILLSFIAKPSQLFRRLAQQVFTACASELDDTALQSIVKILEAKENLSGQEEMFDREDEDGSEGSVFDLGEDDEAETRSRSSSPGEEPDEATSSTDAADSDDDDEVAAFNAKLASIVGTRSGNEDLDAEDTSSSDEEMTDEQMFELNASLENIFREQKKITSSKRNEKKNAKENIVNFKCRVLELLEIYVKHEHGNGLGLSIILPFLTLIRTTTSPLVSRKACDVMREYARLCKGNGAPKIKDMEYVYGLLKAVHVEAMKEGSNAHTSACSQASLLLVRVLVARDRECLRRVVKIYAATQESALFDSSCKVKTSFFTDWLNWCTAARK